MSSGKEKITDLIGIVDCPFLPDGMILVVDRRLLHSFAYEPDKTPEGDRPSRRERLRRILKSPGRCIVVKNLGDVKP